MGSIDNGNLRMLNSDKETKAVSAFKTFFSSTKTKTANDVNATYFFVTHQKWINIAEKK